MKNFVQLFEKNLFISEGNRAVHAIYFLTGTTVIHFQNLIDFPFQTLILHE